MTVTLPPKPLTLYQNYPNPFNPSTAISFYNPAQQLVNIAIYDVSGARVRMLCDRVMAAGKHSIPWNGTNDSGATVGSGVYYYRLVAGKTNLTKKMVVVR
jgi:flagellar hook assembly protein FlgD